MDKFLTKNTGHLHCSDAPVPVCFSRPSNSPLSKSASLNPVISIMGHEIMVLITELVNQNEIYW